MNESVFPQPSTELLADFVKGDPLAIEAVIEKVYPALNRWAQSKHKNLPPEDVSSVLHQVIAETCLNFSRYDPSQSLFTTYVINLFEKRITDLNDKVRQIKSFEDNSQEAREKSELEAYYITGKNKNDLLITRHRFFEDATPRLEGWERDFLELERQGEKKQEVFLAVLQRHEEALTSEFEVKNRKARLYRKLKSLAHEFGYGGDDLLEE